MGSLNLDVCSWDNLSGKVKPFAEVVETLWGEGVVVVLPRELSLDKSTGGQRLTGLDNVKVAGIDLWVLVFVLLLCDKYALTEQVLVDLLAVSLWDKPVNQLISRLARIKS